VCCSGIAKKGPASEGKNGSLKPHEKSLLVLLISGAAQAAIQNVSAVEFTATQAILKYQAPDGAPCTIEVSENPSFLPVVNDVNSVKFASAASDDRAGPAEFVETLRRQRLKIGTEVLAPIVCL